MLAEVILLITYYISDKNSNEGKELEEQSETWTRMDCP